MSSLASCGVSFIPLRVIATIGMEERLWTQIVRHQLGRKISANHWNGPFWNASLHWRGGQPWTQIARNLQMRKTFANHWNARFLNSSLGRLRTLTHFCLPKVTTAQSVISQRRACQDYRPQLILNWHCSAQRV